jgi:methionyl aminopeptidase
MDGLKEYREAGKITAEALRKGAKLIKPGAKLLTVAEAVEKHIKESAKCAFPCNISVNGQAAHYTPSFADTKTFGDSDVVKLDCGAHVDGYIGDAAITVDLSGEHGKLVDASKEALEAAIAAIKPGVKSTDLGALIQKAIERRGFKPIENLTGHVLLQGQLHTGLTIPNVAMAGGWELEEGMAIAIEPFASSGNGRISEGRTVEIFSLERIKPVRNADARKIIEFASEEYDILPFAERWLEPVASGLRLKVALRELMQREVLASYPVLSDAGLVSQAEHTIIVTADGCEVTTG